MFCNHRRSWGLLAGFAVFVWAAGTQAEQRPKAPGKLVAVDGIELHLHCRGRDRGGPSVVLDAGLGGVALEWEAVQDALVKDMTVCSYDRAGMGWSDVSDAPRTTSRMVTELRDLLATGKVDPPYILVGHSFGGYNAQLFASRYRVDTAGVVLLDSSHPEQVERFLAPPIKLNTVPRRRSGVVFTSPPPTPSALPEHLRASVQALLAQYKSMRTAYEELMNFRTSAHEVRDAHVRLDVPVVVVSRGRREWSHGANALKKENLWQDLQRELGTLSPHSAHLLALESGHHIHLEQPRLVADAVRLVVAEINGNSCRDDRTDPVCEMSSHRVAWIGNSLKLAARTVAWKPVSLQLVTTY
jgi:pimeloyl-ACP methyl ester carboxylesterase